MIPNEKYTHFIISIPSNKFRQEIYDEIKNDIDKLYRKVLEESNTFSPKIVDALLENFTDNRYIVLFIKAAIGVNIPIIHSTVVVYTGTEYHMTFTVDKEYLNDEKVQAFVDNCVKEGIGIKHGW